MGVLSCQQTTVNFEVDLRVEGCIVAVRHLRLTKYLTYGEKWKKNS